MILGFEQLHKDQLVLLVTTLWAIWFSRNKKLFANFDLNTNDTIAWIDSYISDYNAAMAMKNRCSNQQTQSKMGFGAVLLDWQGKVVAGLSAPAAGNLQPLIAEALSLRASLEWCVSIQIPLAVIETDSKLLVDKVLSKKDDFSALADVVEDIRCSFICLP
uniref:RNase H type-1 domain-containing protein n=1 Tax=Cannabis sativa TaxID=3483 RepID=A0A803PP89_CANSA